MNFLKVISEKQKKINKELERYFSSKINTLPNFNNNFVKYQYQKIADTCLSDGKRLRPIITLIAYEAVTGKNSDKFLQESLVFELFHNYTLVHDDIYDEDSLRRGKKNNHILIQEWFEKKYPNLKQEKHDLYKDSYARFGVVGGFISGKILYDLSVASILESDISQDQKEKGMRIHQDVSLHDNIGQAIDLAFEPDFSVTEQDYFDMVFCKTGRLFMASAEWGGVLGGASEKQIDVLRKVIEEIAYVFQLKDDLLDVDEKSNKGRDVGSDIKKGKKTLIVIHALKNTNREAKKELLNILGKSDASKKEIKKAIDILKLSGSLEYCEKVAKERAQKAIKYLEKNKNIFKADSVEFFKELAVFMLKRKK